MNRKLKTALALLLSAFLLGFGPMAAAAEPAMSDEAAARADLAALTPQSLNAPEPEAVVTSLRLPPEGHNGTVFSWVSSDPAVVTGSGRVIRPWAGEADRTVTLTVTAAKGDVTLEKRLTFKVSADKVFRDPGYFTDEAFFGRWDEASGRWAEPGKLDYRYVSPGGANLSRVEKAVRAGDYGAAKGALLDYMRAREHHSETKQDRLWADVTADGLLNLQDSSYYQGQAEIPAKWDWYEIPLKADSVSKGGLSTYAVTSWYNEASTLLAEAKGSAHPPELVVKVNGAERVCPVVKNAELRAGRWFKQHVRPDRCLETRLYGAFMGDETSRFLLQFAFKDIEQSAAVSDARLRLYARTREPYAGSKRVLVLKEPSNVWDEKTVSWSDLQGFVYNFNGLQDLITWDRPQGADVEYLYQAARFNPLKRVAGAYEATKDEAYAYRMIRLLEDFIADRGAWHPKGKPDARGQFPRSLDTARRLENFIAVTDIFAQSPWMTPEALTAILKHTWDMANSLTVNFNKKGNRRQTEQKALLDAGLAYPEFKAARARDGWFSRGKAEQESLLFRNTFADGSYLESTGGYSRNAFRDFMNFKKDLMAYGLNVSRAYDERLHKAAYYAGLLRYPDGTSLQYGDETLRTYRPGEFRQIAEWYRDPVFAYIDSFGARGQKPDRTSFLFPDSRLALMRADWTNETPFLFTNVRGGTDGHGHAADGHIDVYAYGRPLLTDSGIFSYTDTNPGRIYGLSTRAHNTVVINGANQVRRRKGQIELWQSNSAYDFIRERTDQAEGFDFARNILFVKPGFWIVSDFIVPDDPTGVNQYRQMWHMYPEAGLTFDAASRTIRSNYREGANILLRAADPGVTTADEAALFDRGYSKVEKTRAGFYQQSIKGPDHFDTLLFPYKSGSPSVEVLPADHSLGSAATALKLSIRSDALTTEAYYFLVHRPETGQRETFAGFETDASMVYLSLKPNGEPEQIFMQDGSYLRTSSGKALVRLDHPEPSYVYSSAPAASPASGPEPSPAAAVSPSSASLLTGASSAAAMTSREKAGSTAKTGEGNPHTALGLVGIALGAAAFVALRPGRKRMKADGRSDR